MATHGRDPGEPPGDFDPGDNAAVSLEDDELEHGELLGEDATAPQRVLSERERRFCELYLGGESAFNASRCYRDAGYAAANDHSASVNSSKLMARPRVRAHLAELVASVRADAKIDLAEVVRELARILRSDPAEALKPDGSVMAMRDWPLHLRRALAGFEVEELYSGKGDDREQIGTVRKFKLWSKTDAAQQLMRHLGGFLEDNKQQAESLADLVVAAAKRGDGK